MYCISVFLISISNILRNMYLELGYYFIKLMIIILKKFLLLVPFMYVKIP